MLYLDETTNEYRLCKEKINYTQDGETIEKYVGSEGHDWWVEFEKTWKNMTINKFIPVEPTDEQKKRFKEVLEGKIKGHQAEFSEYVETGKITEPKPIEEPKEPENEPEQKKEITVEEVYNEVERISKTQAATMLAITDIFEVIVSAQDGNLDTGESNSTTGTEDGSEEERPLSPEEMELLASMGGDLPNIPTPEIEEKP